MANIGRWTSVDPLAEKYPTWSSFSYVKDNPIRFTDPDGKEAKDVNWPPSNYKGTSWNDSNGSFTRNSSTEAWQWTDCSGVCRGPINNPNDPLPSGAVQSMGFVESASDLLFMDKSGLFHLEVSLA